MKFLRLKSTFVAFVFTSTCLFAEEPSLESAPVVSEPASEEVTKTPELSQVVEVVPTVSSKKEQDMKTDRFLKGGFCVLSALFFLAGYLVVKSHEGQRTTS